jgi:CHAT domain-containing protein
MPASPAKQTRFFWLLIFCISWFYPLSGILASAGRTEYHADSLLVGYLRNCNFEKAAATALQLLQQAVPQSKEQASWLLRTSEVHLKLGNLETGNTLLNKAGTILNQLQQPDHLLFFRYARIKGMYLLMEDRTSESLKWLQQAEKHFRLLRDPDPLEAAVLFGEMGRALFRLHRYSTSLQYYSRALEMQPVSTELDRHESNCLKVAMADVCWHKQEKERFDRLTRECLAYLDTTADPLHPSLTEAYLMLYQYGLNLQDRYDTPWDFSGNIAVILEKYFPPDHYFAGIFYAEKADEEYTRNDFENALQYSKRSLLIVEKYPFLNGYWQMNYQIIAQVCFWLERDYEKTIYLSNQAIQRLQPYHLSPAFLYYMIGLSYTMMQNKEMAIRNYNRVIALASDGGLYHDDYDCSIAYHELARIYLYENRHVTAREYLFKSLALSKRIHDKGYRINSIYSDLGNSFNTTGHYRQALQCLQQSIIAGCSTFRDTSAFSDPPPEDIVLTYNLIKTLTLKAYILYSIYEKNNQPLHFLEAALRCQELALKLIEKRIIDIDEEQSGLITADLIRIPMNNSVSYAVLLYLRTREKQYAQKAWEYAEKSKMQVLSINTMKKKNLLSSDLPDSLVEKERKLNEDILEIENRMALDEKYGRKAGSESGALERLASLYGQRDALRTRLEEGFPLYKRLKYNFRVAPMEQIQKILDKDEVVVEYQLLSTEVITFVICRNDFSILFRPIDQKVADNIAILRQVLTSNPVSGDPADTYMKFVRSSYYLYTQLIEPIDTLIKNRRLIIIPHNLLTLLPFEVLINRRPLDTLKPDFRSLSYLIREFPVSYAFSANLLVDRDNDHDFGSGTAIFLPDYDMKNKEMTDLPSLKGAASEAQAIKKLTGGRLYKGPMADKTTFKARAGGYRILHIASHTKLDEKHPGLSCLMMTATADSTGEGNLYSYELTQMELDAQLVVLSGCSTGFGLLRNCEGLVSLARSFFYTGVRTVVLTLWPVADQSGSQLVSEFYKGLRKQQTLDQSMKDAKLNFLQSADPVKAHPFYWAGYIIVGKTDPVPLKKYPVAMLVLPAAVLILFFYLLYRKIRIRASWRSFGLFLHNSLRRNQSH